jgi:hypothetical protein
LRSRIYHSSDTSIPSLDISGKHSVELKTASPLPPSLQGKWGLKPLSYKERGTLRENALTALRERVHGERCFFISGDVYLFSPKGFKSFAEIVYMREQIF